MATKIKMEDQEKNNSKKTKSSTTVTKKNVEKESKKEIKNKSAIKRKKIDKNEKNTKKETIQTNAKEVRHEKKPSTKKVMKKTATGESNKPTKKVISSVSESKNKTNKTSKNAKLTAKPKVKKLSIVETQKKENNLVSEQPEIETKFENDTSNIKKTKSVGPKKAAKNKRDTNKNEVETKNIHPKNVNSEGPLIKGHKIVGEEKETGKKKSIKKLSTTKKETKEVKKNAKKTNNVRTEDSSTKSAKNISLKKPKTVSKPKQDNIDKKEENKAEETKVKEQKIPKKKSNKKSATVTEKPELIQNKKISSKKSENINKKTIGTKKHQIDENINKSPSETDNKIKKQDKKQEKNTKPSNQYKELDKQTNRNKQKESQRELQKESKKEPQKEIQKEHHKELQTKKKQNVKRNDKQKENVNKNIEEKPKKKEIDRKEFLIKPILRKYTIKEDNFDYKEINDDALLTNSQKFNPIIKKVLNSTQIFVRDKLFVDKMAIVVVAVSGGVDSVVMLDILANLSRAFKFELHIAHFDHGLRGTESEEDAKFVEELAIKYGIEFHLSKGKVSEHAKKYKKSIEEAARILRYKFFERIVSSVKANFLATAHNSNDSVETFLMNLIRGAGLTGLSGIPAKRDFMRNCNLLRPIINLTKNEILEYAKLRNIKWREDSSNAENTFTRNRIRNQLIPYLQKEFNPNIINVIGRASSLVNYADSYITSIISPKIDSIINFKDNSRININISLFLTFDEFIRSEMISYLLQRNFKFFKVNLNILDKINNLCSSKSGSVYDIKADIKVIKDRNELIITQNKIFQHIELEVQYNKVYQIEDKTYRFEKIKYSDKIILENNNDTEYIDAENLPPKLMLRTIQDGDSFKPLGMVGTMKISDYLINKKISIIDKKNTIVLTDKLNILWLCGHRINNDFKITDKTKKALKMTVKPVENKI